MSQFDASATAILDAVRAGASIEESARDQGVPVATVRRWLREGRRGKEAYVEFAKLVDDARQERKIAEAAIVDAGPLKIAEAEVLLARAARKGSVPALRLWFDLQSAGDASRGAATTREALERVFGNVNN